jgi:drug/metabolite transporter (DMT)-like permease
MTVGKALSLGGVRGIDGHSQGSIDRGIVLALATGVAFALYLIASRQAERVSAPAKTLTFQCLVGAALLSPQAASPSSPPAGALPLFAALASYRSPPSERRMPRPWRPSSPWN